MVVAQSAGETARTAAVAASPATAITASGRVGAARGRGRNQENQDLLPHASIIPYNREMLFAVTVSVAMAAQTPMMSLSQEYLDRMFVDSPTTASMVGYHQHDVDRKLDSNAPEMLKKRSEWLHAFSRKI